MAPELQESAKGLKRFPATPSPTTNPADLWQPRQRPQPQKFKPLFPFFFFTSDCQLKCEQTVVSKAAIQKLVGFFLFLLIPQYAANWAAASWAAASSYLNSLAALRKQKSLDLTKPCLAD